MKKIQKGISVPADSPPGRSAIDLSAKPLEIDQDALVRTLAELLEIPSPTGYTDRIVHVVAGRLEAMGVPFEITRRGAIRANLKGRVGSPDRAVVSHVDTLGAQVKQIKSNGRLEVVSIGNWSARFAEGARTTVFTESGALRGTILPLKASGHTYNIEIDTQPVAWDNLELRVDERAESVAELEALGIQIGDFIGIDPQPEFTSSGFINSRHLDDKGGVASMLAALEAIRKAQPVLPVDCHFLFTISEEVGSGASAVLHGDVAELVAVDNGTPAPGQNSREFGVTVGMADSSGPFDYHLTNHLLRLARTHGIEHQRDIFRHYFCDATSALEAGNDIRTALLTFGVDASHGYERTHVSALVEMARLLTVYVQSPPAVPRDNAALGSIEDFPEQPQE
ncbi:MAG: osmoprotectant NAGGN system M42 family peptidase [Alphaproteobacteria bacterium]|nr:osmoprotectant NAGGN system M42 family peptidase [Alphaproteobacteria bacterium]